MIERLKQIMEHYKQGSTAFADTLGVPRSSISHLLSGRNKPSLDFILKLINAYPEVNLYWFLNGKGEFPSPASTNTTKPIHSNLDQSTNQLTQPEITNSTPQKEIKQVMMFYTDGSFEVYHPRK